MDPFRNLLESANLTGLAADGRVGQNLIHIAGNKGGIYYAHTPINVSREFG
jgi:hypothetical protein